MTTHEQMDESVDRCFAFNKSGQRCEMVAGHDGNHNVITSWTNDECWTPQDIPIGTPKRRAPEPVSIDKADARCEVCSHVGEMHENGNGPCIACDCKGLVA